MLERSEKMRFWKKRVSHAAAASQRKEGDIHTLLAAQPATGRLIARWTSSDGVLTCRWQQETVEVNAEDLMQQPAIFPSWRPSQEDSLWLPGKRTEAPATSDLPAWKEAARAADDVAQPLWRPVRDAKLFAGSGLTDPETLPQQSSDTRSR
jgi:hypothetical protein